MAEKWIASHTGCICIGNWRRKRSDYACINDGMIDSMPLTLITILPLHVYSFILFFFCIIRKRTGTMLCRPKKKMYYANLNSAATRQIVPKFNTLIKLYLHVVLMLFIFFCLFFFCFR